MRVSVPMVQVRVDARPRQREYYRKEKSAPTLAGTCGAARTAWTTETCRYTSSESLDVMSQYLVVAKRRHPARLV
jgi:hypothetical protein